MNQNEACQAIARHYRENPERFEDEFTIGTPEDRHLMDDLLSRLQDPDQWKPHTKDNYFFIDMSDLDENEYHLDKVLMKVDEDNNGDPLVRYYRQEMEHGPMPGISRSDFRGWLEDHVNSANPYPDAELNGEMKKAHEFDPGDYFRLDLYVDDEHYPYTEENLLVMKKEDRQDGTVLEALDYESYDEDTLKISKHREVSSFVEGPVADEHGMESFFVLLNKRSQDEAFDILMEVFKSELSWFKSRFIVRSDQDRWEFVRHCKNIMKYDHLWEWEKEKGTGYFFFPDAKYDRTIRWNGAGFLYTRFFYDENDKIIGLMMSVG